MDEVGDGPARPRNQQRARHTRNRRGTRPTHTKQAPPARDTKCRQKLITRMHRPQGASPRIIVSAGRRERDGHLHSSAPRPVRRRGTVGKREPEGSAAPCPACCGMNCDSALAPCPVSTHKEAFLLMHTCLGREGESGRIHRWCIRKTHPPATAVAMRQHARHRKTKAIGHVGGAREFMNGKLASVFRTAAGGAPSTSQRRMRASVAPNNRHRYAPLHRRNSATPASSHAKVLLIACLELVQCTHRLRPPSARRARRSRRTSCPSAPNSIWYR